MSDRSHSPLADLLDPYLAGTCSEEQRQQMERYLTCRPEVARRISVMRRKLDGGTPTVPAVGPVLEHVVHRVRESNRYTSDLYTSELPIGDLHTAQESPLLPTASKRSSLFQGYFHSPRVWYTIGSIACAMALVVLGWQGGRFSHSQSSTTEFSTYVTPKGQRASLVLQDGTTVFLNVGSRLEVPANYSLGNRALRLQGEAVFTVSHRTQVPFTVVAGPSTTRVLGTSFVIRHYPTDSAATIAVRDGKVDVNNVVLSALQQVTVKETGVSPIGSTSLERFSFERGILVLDDVPLSEAIADLNRWYDTDIRLGNQSLAEQSLKGSFATGSIPELAKILSLAFDVRVVRQGRMLTLYPR